jgi:alpha-L-rhamnosidase
MEWKANWIWDKSGEHPRNQWNCFRRTFTISTDYESATLSISADTKYFVYINDELIGSGPVRGWTSEWHYDQYELSNLRKGKNVISILVNHYGMGTMHYIEGRGGLIAQLEFYQQGQIIGHLLTDERWKTATHDGFIKESVKMSNCLSWAEIYNANRFDHDWGSLSFEDSAWEEAKIIGPYGSGPWKTLIPRDIPPLTNEMIYPKSVLSLKAVRPISQHYSIDLKPTFFPGEFDCNSGKIMQGYLVTELHSKQDTTGDMTLTFDAHAGAKWEYTLNGEEYKTQNGKYEKVSLRKGANLLLIDVGGFFHEPTMHLAFTFPEEIKLKAPFSREESKFLGFGPFYSTTLLQIGKQVDLSVRFRKKMNMHK